MPPADQVVHTSITHGDFVKLKNFLVVEYNTSAVTAELAVCIGLMSTGIAATALLDNEDHRVQNAKMISTMLNQLWRALCEERGVAPETFVRLLNVVIEQHVPPHLKSHFSKGTPNGQ